MKYIVFIKVVLFKAVKSFKINIYFKVLMKMLRELFCNLINRFKTTWHDDKE